MWCWPAKLAAPSCRGVSHLVTDAGRPFKDPHRGLLLFHAVRLLLSIFHRRHAWPGQLGSSWPRGTYDLGASGQHSHSQQQQQQQQWDPDCHELGFDILNITSALGRGEGGGVQARGEGLVRFYFELRGLSEEEAGGRGTGPRKTSVERGANSFVPGLNCDISTNLK